MPPWIDEANWPEAWAAIDFSPIVWSSSGYIVYAIGWGVSRLYEYNLLTQTWTNLTVTPVQLYNPISMSPDGTRLAAHSGNGRYLFIYNITSNSWTTSSIAPVISVTLEVPQIQTTVWADDDTIWCHVRGAGTNRNKCYRYVISTDTWTQFGNVYVFGPQNNSQGMSINSAGTRLFVGKVSNGANRTLGMRYIIATDAYAQFNIVGGWDYLRASDRAARLWVVDAIATYIGTRYYNCDTEAQILTTIFPDSDRATSSQNLPCGIYGEGFIIAHHKIVEPKNRSYLISVPPIVQTDPATGVT